MRNIRKNSFTEALEAKKDDVYVRILQDVSSLHCIRCEDFLILPVTNHTQAAAIAVILCQNPLQLNRDILHVSQNHLCQILVLTNC